MPTSEALLQELVELKRRELRGQRLKFWIHFSLITLPSFVLIVLSIYAAWVFASQAQDFIQNFPEMIQETMSQSMENQKDGFIEGIEDRFR